MDRSTEVYSRQGDAGQRVGAHHHLTILRRFPRDTRWLGCVFTWPSTPQTAVHVILVQDFHGMELLSKDKMQKLSTYSQTSYAAKKRADECLKGTSLCVRSKFRQDDRALDEHFYRLSTRRKLSLANQYH